MCSNLSDMKKEIVAIMAETLGVAEEQVALSASLRDLDMDSLDMFEIIMKIEEMSGKQIESEQIMKLETINDVLQLAD